MLTKIIIGTLIFAVVAGIGLFAYAACAVAGKADRDVEEMYRKNNQ